MGTDDSGLLDALFGVGVTAVEITSGGEGWTVTADNGTDAVTRTVGTLAGALGAVLSVFA